MDHTWSMDSLLDTFHTLEVNRAVEEVDEREAFKARNETEELNHIESL